MKNTFNHIKRFVFSALLLALCHSAAFAQLPLPDSVRNKSQQAAGGSFIEILNSQYTDLIQKSSQQITKIVGNVQLRSGTDMLYCDSAVINNTTKMAEAFGNVSIVQADGTEAYADYLRYNGGSRLIFMKGDVMLTDNKGNDLWSEEVDYNLSTKVGKYYKKGTLQSEQTILSSRYGEYNMRSKQARFKGDVVVNDPEYTVTSEDLGYNTESKIVRFYAPAVVQNDKTTLIANNGTYDAKNKKANFTGRTNIIHEAQFIEADEVQYDKNTGWARAKGDVVAIDTAQKSTSYSDFVMYNEVSGKMISIGKPIMKRKSDKDSLFIIADTFFSEPIANLSRPDAGPVDTAQLQLDALIKNLKAGVEVDSTKVPLQGKEKSNNAPYNTEKGKADTLLHNSPSDTAALHIKSKADSIDMPKMDIELGDSTILDNTDTAMVDSVSLAAQDSIAPAHRPDRKIRNNPGSAIYDKAEETKDDENRPRYFTAYHNVKMYSDSAQAKCDSLRYSQADSLMILYKNPVVWAKQSQVLGDTIYALLDSSKVQEVYVPKNAILIQQSGPEQAGLYDQIQATRLHAFFVNNELDSATAYPNVETIYFLRDDDSAYIGASQASSNKLRIQFKEQKIKRIYYLEDFKNTVTPMGEVDPAAFRLTRFNWREKERPKTLEELLQNASEFQKHRILGKDYREPKPPASKPEKASGKKKKK